MTVKKIFKRCTSCFSEWKTREEFLNDASLELNGYRVNYQELERGLFFFTHKKAGCCSSMALEAREFLDLFGGPRYAERKTHGEKCPRYCDDEKQPNRCDALCECAFVREVIDIIRNRNGAWPGQGH